MVPVTCGRRVADGRQSDLQAPLANRAGDGCAAVGGARPRRFEVCHDSTWKAAGEAATAGRGNGHATAGGQDRSGQYASGAYPCTAHLPGSRGGTGGIAARGLRWSLWNGSSLRRMQVPRYLVYSYFHHPTSAGFGRGPALPRITSSLGKERGGRCTRTEWEGRPSVSIHHPIRREEGGAEGGKEPQYWRI